MKRKYGYQAGDKTIEREYNYIPVRYIIASDDNPDDKIPWLLFILILPIAGFMLYFIFGSRTLQKRFIKRLQALKDCGYKKEDSALFNTLKQQSPTAASQTKMLVNIAETHPFTDTKQKYYPLGEDMHQDMLQSCLGAFCLSL